MENFKLNFDNWLKEILGDYEISLIPIDYSKGRICYSKPLYIDNTIQMVIRPPIILDYITNNFKFLKEIGFNFFLYDMQTDLVFGNISELDKEDWKEDLYEHIILAEDRMIKSYCPCSCRFWLLERTNLYGHKFMGCSGYPECEFSTEIDKLYELPKGV